MFIFRYELSARTNVLSKSSGAHVSKRVYHTSKTEKLMSRAIICDAKASIKSELTGGVPKNKSILLEGFRPISSYLLARFPQISSYLPEWFLEISVYLPERFRQITSSLVIN